MDNTTPEVVKKLIVALVVLVYMVLLSSCTTTRPPQEPLLSVSPALVLDSLPEPEVRYKRPAYVQSLPLMCLNSPESAQQQPAKPDSKGFVRNLFGANFKQLRGNARQKDQRRLTVNIYNAPAKVKNGNVATGSGTVLAPAKQVDRSEDQRHHDDRNQDHKNADLRQKQLLKTGFSLPAGVWIALLLVLLFVLWRRFWKAG